MFYCPIKLFLIQSYLYQLVNNNYFMFAYKSILTYFIKSCRVKLYTLSFKNNTNTKYAYACISYIIYQFFNTKFCFAYKKY